MTVQANMAKLSVHANDKDWDKLLSRAYQILEKRYFLTKIIKNNLNPEISSALWQPLLIEFDNILIGH